MKIKFGLIVVSILTLTSAAICDTVKPLAMSLKALGGGDIVGTPTNGVEGGKGLNNIGLLIKTWGKVTYKDPAGAFFYIDDGSALQDGTKNGTVNIIGVRVGIDSLATGNSISMANLVAGQSTVTIVGVISTFADSAQKIHPKVRPRNQLDVITAQ